MEYKIITVKAVGFLGTNFEKAANELAEEVSRHIAAGWEPQGGVCTGSSYSTQAPSLFQAMIERR
jgi:hypothetical protein